MNRQITGYYIKVLIDRPRFTEGRTFKFKNETSYQRGLNRLNRLTGLKVWLHGATYEPIVLDYTQITDVELDGIDHSDYPDYVDTFISSATYQGRDMTDEELDTLNEDRDYVYNKLMNYLY